MMASTAFQLLSQQTEGLLAERGRITDFLLKLNQDYVHYEDARKDALADQARIDGQLTSIRTIIQLKS